MRYLDKKHALVIFSGGQDSTTCLGWAKSRYEKVTAISFVYGQKHDCEIKQAKKIAQSMDVEHHIIEADFFGGLVNSALTHNGDVNAAHEDNAALPASFVPNRNAFFITLAHAFAQKINAGVLVTGTCETDFSGYPDCRRVFIDAICMALNLGSDTNIVVETPLMYIDKADTFKLALDENCLLEVLHLSHTCYNGTEQMNDYGRGCGVCPACELRARGYDEFVKRYPSNIVENMHMFLEHATFTPEEKAETLRQVAGIAPFDKV